MHSRCCLLTEISFEIKVNFSKFFSISGIYLLQIANCKVISNTALKVQSNTALPQTEKRTFNMVI